MDKELIHKASDNMKRRYRYSYSILDLAYSYLIPIKIFCCCKKTLRNIHTRYLLFKKGEEKFAKEFDAVSFVRNQRRLKMMINWLMDKSERFLAVYQKSNAISLSTESEDQSDDPVYTNVPKMLSNINLKQKHIGIVNKFFVSHRW